MARRPNSVVGHFQKPNSGAGNFQKPNAGVGHFQRFYRNSTRLEFFSLNAHMPFIHMSRNA